MFRIILCIYIYVCIYVLWHERVHSHHPEYECNVPTTAISFSISSFSDGFCPRLFRRVAYLYILFLFVSVYLFLYLMSHTYYASVIHPPSTAGGIPFSFCCSFFKHCYLLYPLISAVFSLVHTYFPLCDFLFFCKLSVCFGVFLLQLSVESFLITPYFQWRYYI